ncbi:MAG: hypothetical protein EOO75_21175, partial [Myxococcales bacterium]
MRIHSSSHGRLLAALALSSALIACGDDDEALRQELLHARAISHPNICRVHDLAPSPWGPILVMEHIAGQTLHSH